MSLNVHSCENSRNNSSKWVALLRTFLTLNRHKAIIIQIWRRRWQRCELEKAERFKSFCRLELEPVLMCYKQKHRAFCCGIITSRPNVPDIFHLLWACLTRTISCYVLYTWNANSAQVHVWKRLHRIKCMFELLTVICKSQWINVWFWDFSQMLWILNVLSCVFWF